MYSMSRSGSWRFQASPYSARRSCVIDIAAPEGLARTGMLAQGPWSRLEPILRKWYRPDGRRQDRSAGRERLDQRPVIGGDLVGLELERRREEHREVEMVPIGQLAAALVRRARDR